MSTLDIINLAGAVSGRLGDPLMAIETVRCVDGKIAALGADGEAGDADVTLDANGAILAPGLIDTHVHVTFGDWTPRQQTVGWIESYMHGGTTLMMSASEIHVPGSLVRGSAHPRMTPSKSVSIRISKCFLFNTGRSDLDGL